MNLLRGELQNASFDETRARLEAEIRGDLSSLENLFCLREGESLRGSEFFSVSVGACRIREIGEGDYVAEIFAAGDFRVYLLDEFGMAPLWHTDTPTLSPSNDEPLRGEALRFHHPDPFAVILVSESICALNAAEQRSLRSNPGLIWRYRMRLEDVFLRLVTDCVRDYEFGDRATRFFVGRSHGRDSASGAMTVLRNGISHETFRLHCQTRLSALGRLIELLPGGYDVQNVPVQESRTETEMTHIRGLLEQKPELADRLTNALRLHALDKFRAGEAWKVTELPADIPDYVRLEWKDIQKAYGILDQENLEDRTRIAENNRMLRECLSEHWITLRDVFSEPLDSEDTLIRDHETVSERIFHSCLDLNRRLAEMLQKRQATVIRLSDVLSDSLMTLEAEGNDWLCGRADADGMLAWARPLRREILEQMDRLEENWRADTQKGKAEVTGVQFNVSGEDNMLQLTLGGTDYPMEGEMKIPTGGLESIFSSDDFFSNIIIDGKAVSDYIAECATEWATAYFNYDGYGTIAFNVPGLTKDSDISSIILKKGFCLPAYENPIVTLREYKVIYYSIDSAMEFAKDENGVWTLQENVSWTVTFDGENAVKVADGEKIPETAYPEDPVKEGYTFIGWYSGAREWRPTDRVTSDLNLTAKFQENASGDNSQGGNTDNGGSKKKSGCGSIVGSIGVTALITLAGVALTLKKKQQH
jgi:uncharacterized repeat protein (TIGR02543 family)